MTLPPSPAALAAQVEAIAAILRDCEFWDAVDMTLAQRLYDRGMRVPASSGECKACGGLDGTHVARDCRGAASSAIPSSTPEPSEAGIETAVSWLKAVTPRNMSDEGYRNWARQIVGAYLRVAAVESQVIPPAGAAPPETEI